MSDKAPARPRQVTVAAWLIILGSVFVVVSAFDQVASTGSLETRERVESLLADPPADGLGLSVNGVIEMLRVLAMIAAAAATAAAILGIQVLQRSRASRVLLSVLAVPLFVTGAFTGGFMGALVAAAIVMLWLQPARAWFAGKPLPERFNPDGTLRAREPKASAAATTPSTDREHQPVGSSAPWAPPAPQGPPPHGQQAPHDQPGPAAYPGFGSPEAARQQGAPPPGTHATRRQRRPAQLVWACALTWAMSALVSLALLMLTLSLAVTSQSDFSEMLAQQPDLQADVDEVGWSALTQGIYFLTAVSVVWSLVASVLAVLAFRGVAWARVTLTVSAGAATGIFFMFAVSGFATAPLAGVLMMIPLGAVAAAFFLLLRPAVRTWRP
ncbi:hypothetical protein I601_0939 [Nocardioides dokdonensis FR1436]|uniref:Uncharacterized protein n=1 Tax=Nocardioides dokdonensis FR1436 TaxID=1300347 RepID=A0A1A9GI99_9ACTN|nr:hypothetical protein [Nocardioides dokdonensis]ANH37382.1 hypothetical protein I601_0939 [Nocardioides dokdonensis FR1436]